jgi:hypothetical protein
MLAAVLDDDDDSKLRPPLMRGLHREEGAPSHRLERGMVVLPTGTAVVGRRISLIIRGRDGTTTEIRIDG